MIEQIKLTVPVARVLAAFLADPAAERYGLDLMKATGLPSGTLYPVLVRLRQAGWVEARWEQLDASAAGRPARRYYRLSSEGTARAAAELATLRSQTSPAARITTEPRPAW